MECRKRPREEDGGWEIHNEPDEKRIRPTVESEDQPSYRDSVISTLGNVTQLREQVSYDSDEESTSMVSEPGSPQDAFMSLHDGPEAASYAHEDDLSTPRMKPSSSSSPWGVRVWTDRVPTPMVSSGSGIRKHVRQRHPQQNAIAAESSSSDCLLDVPSPIDEDEVPTPPSAAEAAGSQLSMLTVSDVDMDGVEDSVPSITVNLVRSSSGEHRQAHRTQPHDPHLDSAIDMEPADTGPEAIIVPKQRQRSGALSGGNPPIRAELSTPASSGHRRGFSMGFRADCEKCRMRVPGHMNHFVGQP